MQAGIKVISEDLNSPSDREIDVVKVFRRKTDGELEAKPAIRIYKSMSDLLDVAVIDLDKEGELG